MSLARVLSRAQVGLEAPLVCVEVHVGSGLPSFAIVGLPAPVVRESKERVRSALVNSGFEFPAGRLTVNLAPADLPKAGGRFDLPIALGVLRASGQLRDGPLVETCECFGELGLAGELKAIGGLLPAALQAGRAGRRVVIPRGNRDEALLAGCHDALAADTLAELCAMLRSGAPAPVGAPDVLELPVPRSPGGSLADVRGQLQAKRALVIAAAGGHSLLMVGSPGAGKTLLAQRLPGLLPALRHEEALQVAAMASIGPQGFDFRAWGQRPFRAPHHTASAHALVGGGSEARAGEISLAHLGVLFLDELPEFDRRVLEALREPLESGLISIARASIRAEYPARFQLVAAMNPCPCGYLGDGSDRCRCGPAKVQRYRQRISGPLLDRIDLQVVLGGVDPRALRTAAVVAEDAELPARIADAHARQVRRQGCCNARLPVAGVLEFCSPDEAALRVLERAMQRFTLSARAYHRVLRVARTIADLEGAEALTLAQVAEALALRQTQQEEAGGSASVAGDARPAA